MTCLEFMDNDIFNNLRVLNLEGNPIEYWEEVNKLGQLPKYIFYTFFCKLFDFNGNLFNF